MDSLRDNWTILTQLAEETRQRLLGEQRTIWEREVDKKVKSFVVLTIQFRNSFDMEGPLVPGLTPNEAVVRLGETSGWVWSINQAFPFLYFLVNNFYDINFYVLYLLAILAFFSSLLFLPSGSFLEGYKELKRERHLLTTVQQLLNIPSTPYPELVQTEQDLSYLHALYGNYQQFIDFDKRYSTVTVILLAMNQYSSCVYKTCRCYS